MVKYGDSGRAHRCHRGRHRPKRQPIDAISFFFSIPAPLVYSLSFSAWKGNQEQAINQYPLLWATQCWVIERNHSGTCEDRSNCRRWSWKLRRGEGRRKGFSGLCRHLCDEMVVDEEPSKPARLFRSGCSGRRGKTVVATQKGRLSSEKVDTLPQGKTFAGLLCDRARAKRKVKKSKIKRTKRTKPKKETELDQARGSPIEKTYRKLHSKSSL